jgi:hypothetical protein
MRSLTAKMDDKDQKIAKLEKAIREIDIIVDDAMGEKLIGARALMSLRWARKIAAIALGQEDD